jgi:hypothetical protein
MMTRVFSMAVILLTGCAQDQAPTAIPFELATDMQHTMELILDPAADKIWDSAGFIITDAGERDLAPTTDEGWREVESAAAVVAEAGNLLLMPGRSEGADWDTYSVGLREAGKLAMQAALDQDADALFAAGGNIYQVCKACHSQYLIEEEAAQ